MSDTRFTKGPWVCVEEDFGANEIEITSELRIKNSKSSICGMDIYYDEPHKSEQVANMHLIKVAPEMYDLLNALEAECNMFYEEFGEPSNGEYGARFVEIKGLLAKARGEHESSR